MEAQKLRQRITYLLIFFVVALVVSGLTAFPLKWEVTVLNDLFGAGSFMENLWPAMSRWISFVHEGLIDTYTTYPFIAYGTDWLAFAHLVIAVAFYGAFRDPVRNVWVIEFAMIACVMVIPLAMIAGSLRGIPFVWRLLDCSFGVFGIIPLWFIWRDTRRLERLAGAGA